MTKCIVKSFIIALILFTTFSCKKRLPNVNSELICPNTPRVLVKFIREKDLKVAIRNAYLEKKRLNTADTYTAIKLPDGRTMAFRGIPPEIAVTCLIVESYVGFADKRYVYH
ncbi:MAG: hypothetical protein KGQ36_03595 [Rickettsiales bacterium]|nr:hypothetical protein [Rickettsiales bacterium]